MSHEAIPTEVVGFHVLPISLPPPKAYPKPATHYLYVRPDAPKVPSAKTPRTLFLSNIPFDTTDAHVKALFGMQLGLPAGRVEEVEYDDKPPRTQSQGPQVPVLPSKKKNRKRKRAEDAEDDTVPELEGSWPETWDRELHIVGSSATVVFIDRASMEAAVKAVRKAIKTGKKVIWGQCTEGKVPPLGSKRYLEHQKRCYPPQAALLKIVNDYMTAYAAREAARSKALARQRSEPDADGFVTVSRGGRTGAARQEDALEHLEKQNEKQQGFNDFYRFQSREKRKEKAHELLRKFEDDKERVRKMREQRKRFRVSDVRFALLEEPMLISS
jgi:ribosomal RNA-processing protein 7